MKDPVFWGIVTGNVVVALLLAGAAWFVCRVLPREPWKTAVRQIRRRPVVLASLAMLLLYTFVALLDSVSWRDVRTDAQGRSIQAPKGSSVLDRLCTPLRNAQETTYSAPLADSQFSRNLIRLPDGTSRWESKPLNHPGKHLMGTDKVGQDVFYRALKGIRTAMLLGALTLLIAVPFAVFFGVVAGYFGGWADDVIQYVYTTVASIPSILLIAAFVLIFGRGLTQICIILGITSWTGLCRLTRAETLKLRELEYVQAAVAIGTSRARILLKHVAPNLMHLVLIHAVLQFSGLVLAESVLAYVGVGVGPETGSWGNMINSALLELSRDPKVWWNLAGAFLLMFGLVLPANLFGDALRDALDPRLRQR